MKTESPLATAPDLDSLRTLRDLSRAWEPEDDGFSDRVMQALSTTDAEMLGTSATRWQRSPRLRGAERLRWLVVELGNPGAWGLYPWGVLGVGAAWWLAAWVAAQPLVEAAAPSNNSIPWQVVRASSNGSTVTPTLSE